MKLLKKIHRLGTTIILATHNKEIIDNQNQCPQCGNSKLEAKNAEFLGGFSCKGLSSIFGDIGPKIFNKGKPNEEDLKRAGINLKALSKLLKNPDADEFDLIAHILFKAPLLSRDERARALLDLKKEFIEKYGTNAREIILELVDRYRIAGIDEITDPRIFRTPPFDKMGALKGVIEIFGGIEALKEAIQELESGLYPEFGGLG